MLLIRSSSSRLSVLAVTGVFSILVLAAALMPIEEAKAAQILVNETTDELQFSDGDEDCSLREAVVSANENIGVDGCTPGGQVGTDQILLPADTYPITIDGTGEEQGYTGDLDVTEALSIVGQPGKSGALPVIDAGGSTNQCFTKGSGEEGTDRIFHVQPEQQSSTAAEPEGITLIEFELTDLTVTGGSVFNDPEGGGGILVDNGDLGLDNVRVTENWAESGSEFSIVQGGGISLLNNSLIEAEDSRIDANSAFGFAAVGGGLAVGQSIAAPESAREFRSAAEESSQTEALGTSFEVLLDDTRMDGNAACGLFAVGGGMSSVFDSNLTNVDFESNEVFGSSIGVGGGADLGGGLGAIFLSPSGAASSYLSGTIEDNEAVSFGSNFGGGGGAAPEGPGVFAPFAAGGGVFGSGGVQLRNLSIDNNTAQGFDQDGETFAAGGGAAHAFGGLLVDSTTFSSNTSSALGSPPEVARLGGEEENGNALGGGLSLSDTQAEIENSTFSDNTSVQGAGVAIVSSQQQNGSEPSGPSGGPISTIRFTTITDNNAFEDEAAGLLTRGFWDDPGAVGVYATIIGDQEQGDDCRDESDGQSPMITDLGNNIDSDGTCNWTEQSSVTANPRLEELDDNGGETLTHALQPNSPAVDEAQGQGCPDDDQRGENRPQNGDGAGGAQCDIGAFELEAPGGPQFCPGFASDPRPQIIGTAANNTLNGSNADEIICGKAGNDTINGGGGDDLILGGPDKDTLKGQGGGDRIVGGGDNDTVNGNGGNDRLRGFPGNDNLNGDDGEDRITGGVGDDKVNGDAGDDKVFGWDDADEVNGNAGNDLTFGSLGDDAVDGGPGNDRVRGFKGDDTLFGRGGEDKLVGGFGDDGLNGGPDTDTCFGGPGTNTLTNCP